MSKTITISDKMWQKLNRLKTNLVARSYDIVLEKMFKLIQRFHLAKELEAVK